MINYCSYEEKYQDQMYDVFYELTQEEVFFKELSKEEFKNQLFNNPFFKLDGTFVALKDEKVVGFISSNVRDMDKDNEKASGYINTLIVKKTYRRQGIGSKLLSLAENYIKKNNMKSVRFVFLSQINWPWYIPYTNKHEHPGMPAVRMNSDFYLFLYHHGYFVNSIHEGFHLDLDKYTMPEKVVKQMAENEKRG